MRMNRRVQRTKVWGTVLLVGAMLLLWTSSMHGAYEYEYQDTTSSTSLEGHATKINGDHMVWLGADAAGKSQVFYRRISSGEKEQITSHDKLVDSPLVSTASAGHAIIAWSDKRGLDGEPPQYWDIYAYDMSLGTELKLNSVPGENRNITVDGNHVAWMNVSTKEVYVYDVTEQQEIRVGEGRFPVVAEGKVVFKSADTGGLELYDIQSGTTEVILELPYHRYVDWFTFNGEKVLYKERNLDRETKYVMLDLRESDPEPVDLTVESKKEREYSQMVIGETQAAWKQEVNGSAQIMGVDLTSGQTHQMTKGTGNHTLYGFEGDQLLMAGTDGALMIRTIIKKEIISNDSDEDEVSIAKPGVAVGQSGGVVEADGAQLTIPAGALTSAVRINLEEHDGEEGMEKLVRAMTRISAVWSVATDPGVDAFAQPATFSVAYEPVQMTSTGIEKAAIYRWDDSEAAWIYIGGEADEAASQVVAEIQQPGLYAAMLYEPTFADIQGHWAQETVEWLAAHWIIHGMNELEFRPEDRLTRAQFVKLLVGASGETTAQNAGDSRFEDVGTEHWAHGYIERAATLGWVQGAQGRFNPDSLLTREEMMTILVRAMGDEVAAKQQSQEEIEATLAYTDGSEISAWARPTAAWAVREGLLTGFDGRLKPVDVSTRAEGAAVIHRWLMKRGEQ